MVVLATTACAEPPAKLKIYINTDLEGASGVYQFAQSRESGTPFEPRGLSSISWTTSPPWCADCVMQGVAEILVLDGHGSGAVIPHRFAPGAKYITGKPRSGPLSGLDDTFHGMIMLGFHAMMGTPDGVLNHTQSSKTENRYWYNDIESGELAQSAAIAGHFGVPTIMVTGDEATCREARNFFGEYCVTVAVKQGLSREAAVLYPMEESRQTLYEGAKQAVAAIPKCHPYKLKLPIQARKQYLQFDLAPARASSSPRKARSLMHSTSWTCRTHVSHER